MACSHDTQTRPKFHYIFTALDRENMAAGLVLVSVEAEALYEARAKLKGRYTATFFRERHPAGDDCTKFTWRFLALSRTDRNAKPCRLSVEATTERDARRILAPHFILSLAARMPPQGGVEITTPSTIEKTSMEVRYAC